MAGAIYLLLVGLTFCARWLTFLWQRHHQPHPGAAAVAQTVQRLLKPRTPSDCPACRRQLALPPSAPAPPSPVRPWRERKRRRGAPKRINSDGFACPTTTCSYYRITALST